MASEFSVILVTHESETAEAVSAALGSENRISLSGVCANLSALAPHLKKATVSAVLIDISDRPVHMLKKLNPIIRSFHETHFIILNDELQNDLILEAMKIGARYFLSKETIGETLLRILQTFLTDTASREVSHRGIVTTILSASGGCGSTTIAVNLANELQLLDARPTLLMDLDTAYGGIATYLGLTGQYGVADVLDYKHGVDPALVKSSALAFSDNLDVLVSPVSVNLSNPRTLSYENLPEVLVACRQAYDVTVIDAPRVSMDIAATLAEASVITLICSELTVRDTLFIRAMVRALRERGIPLDKILPVANRYRKRNSMFNLNEERKALGGMEIQCIGNDYAAAAKSMNYGQPIAKIAPRSALRRDLRPLVARIAAMRYSSPDS